MKNFTLLLIALLFATICSLKAQNTFPSTGAAGIGTTSPNASSLLDVTSTSKGVLVPRMNKTQRDAIASPATGLLIYQTNSTPGFYYYSGSAWTAVSAKGANAALSNLTTTTAVNTNLLPATTNALNLGSSALNWKNMYAAGSYYIGSSKVLDVSGTNNTFIGATGNTANSGTANSFLGSGAGQSNSTGSYNTAQGLNALNANTTSFYNTAFGAYALSLNTGTRNTAVGEGALLQNTTAQDNTAVGTSALYSNTIGFQNTANGSAALYANTIGSYNTANGEGALYSNTAGNSNTANGSVALYSNTTGSGNTANGGSALYLNTTGNYNTANGTIALYSNTTGSGNTANGYQSLYSNISGYDNTANGYQSLYSNISGYDNTANGYQSLYYNIGFSNAANGYQSLFFNTTGSGNAANGNQSLYSNTTGSNNTANGYVALENNTGSGNTAIGSEALYYNISGYSNTANGYYTDVNNINYSNSSAFGYLALITASNQVRIGDGDVTSIGGYVNWSNISDGRFKKNIKDDVKGLEFINKLQPITYTLDIHGVNNFLRKDMPEIKTPDGKIIERPKEDEEAMAAKEKIVYSGFIAQDVEKSAKEVGYDFSGVDAPKNDRDVYGLRYAEFVVPLVKAVQELSQQDDGLKTEDVRQETRVDSLQFTVSSLLKENAEMKTENSDQQKQIDELKTIVAQLQSSISNQQSSMTSGYAELKTINQPVPIFSGKPETILGQNIPNPFDNSTLIPFRIPKDCYDASLMITNTSSSEVVSVIPVSCNEDHISIDAGTLASGMYSYTLYVDGKMIDTKKMELVR